MTDEDASEMRMASAVIREFPPLLNIEHQQLIRDVESMKVLIKADRELLESRIDGLSDKLNERYSMQTEALKAALEAAEKAVDKANTASEKRFDGVNEFRGQLSDIIGTMMPRAESMALIKGLEDKVSDMKSTVDSGFSGFHASQDTSRWMKTDNRASYAGYYALGGVCLTAIIVIVAIMNLMTGAR